MQELPSWTGKTRYQSNLKDRAKETYLHNLHDSASTIVLSQLFHNPAMPRSLTKINIRVFWILRFFLFQPFCTFPWISSHFTQLFWNMLIYTVNILYASPIWYNSIKIIKSQIRTSGKACTAGAKSLCVHTLKIILFKNQNYSSKWLNMTPFDSLQTVGIALEQFFTL